MMSAFLTPPPSGVRRTIKLQCSYYSSSRNTTYYTYRYLSPPNVGPCPYEAVQQLIMELSSWVRWASKSTAYCETHGPCGFCTDARAEQPEGRRPDGPEQNFAQPRATCWKVHAAPAAPGARILEAYAQTGARSVRGSTRRQKAQIWQSKLRRELFTYTLAILEICIRKGRDLE